MQGSVGLIQLSAGLLTGAPKPENMQAVRTLAVGWINDLYRGSQQGIYGTPGETISTGDATAVVLPAPPTAITPIVDLLRQFLLFQENIIFNLL